MFNKSSQLYHRFKELKQIIYLYALIFQSNSWSLRSNKKRYYKRTFDWVLTLRGIVVESCPGYWIKRRLLTLTFRLLCPPYRLRSQTLEKDLSGNKVDMSQSRKLLTFSFFVKSCSPLLVYFVENSFNIECRICVPFNYTSVIKFIAVVGTFDQFNFIFYSLFFIKPWRKTSTYLAAFVRSKFK